MTPKSRTEADLLEFLRGRGASRLRYVRLRRNRSTIWSLTRSGQQLNLHRAFAAAPDGLLVRFVVIANEGARRTEAASKASDRVSAWPPLEADLRRIRMEDHRHGRRSSGFGVGPCCATRMQLTYLGRMYRYLNHTRFSGRLPASVPIRLSNRMRSRLGQMVPGEVDGRRRVLEIALNVDLMLSGNGRIRLDTLVHEMAHAADWIFEGEVGHGASWRRWAEYAGCEARACCEVRLRRRRRGHAVTRVPRLPLGARLLGVA